MFVRLSPTADSSRVARRAVTDAARALGRADLIDDVVTVVTELVTNAVLHAGPEIGLSVTADGAGLRVAVTDGSHVLPPGWTPTSPMATSGRGLMMVERLSSRWGADRGEVGGKTVWAHVDHPATVSDDISAEDLLAQWEDRGGVTSRTTPTTAVDVEVDVAEMLESRVHTSDLVRALQLTLVEAEFPSTRATPEVVRLARRLVAANRDFHDARDQMWIQTLAAAKRGQARTTLNLQLHRDDADAARSWIDALDQADALTAAGLLLLPPFPPGMTAFRRRYIDAIVTQLDTGGG